MSSLLLIAAACGLMALPGADAVWASWVEGTSSWVHVVLAVFLLHAVVFWGMSGAFWWIEKTGRLARWRIQTGKTTRPPRAAVVKNLLVNQLLITPALLVLLPVVLELRGWQVDTTLPGPVEVLVDLVGMGVFAAIWFYASHRFLHRPWWMKRVHRVHHEFRTTQAWAAEYAHPFEMVVANFGTLSIGVILLAPDLATLYLYTIVGTHTFVAHHSGYAVPWFSWSVHHDWHHYKYTEAFGTYGILDRLLGTDKQFRELEDGEEVK